MTSPVRFAVAAGLALVAIACGREGPPADGGTPELTAAALRSATYESQYLDDGVVRLEDGMFADTARRTVVSLLPEYAVGDLDGDGAPDAAVILATNTGGSGTFRDLAIVLNRSGEPASGASLFLGDRVLVDRIGIVEGEIRVDLTMHGPADPMCCPSLAANRRFRLVGGILTEMTRADIPDGPGPTSRDSNP